MIYQHVDFRNGIPMGFFDKVKSTVGDVSDSVGKRIDTGKYDLKIKDEQKRIDKASLEIGRIVSEMLINGESVDPERFREHYDIIVDSKRRIAEFTSMKEEITGESYEKDVAAPEEAYALPEAEEIVETVEDPVDEAPVEAATVQEETVIEEPAEAPAVKNDFMSKLVPSNKVGRSVEKEPTEEVAEIEEIPPQPVKEEAPAPSKSVEAVSEPVPSGTAIKVETPEEGSMLSRISSTWKGANSDDE